MSAKVSSKKAQEGINTRLQVVMRSGKYTVRSFRLERGSSSLRVQDDDDDDDFGGPDGFVFATTTTTTTSRRSLLQISLISFFLSFFLSLSL